MAEQTAPAPQSLYSAILGAVQNDGTLPRSFSLPRPSPEDPHALRFADGAMDGIALYHMAPGKQDVKSLTEVLGLISAGSFDAAKECLHLFFSAGQFVTMLPLIDDMQQWIVDHKDVLDPARLYTFSMDQLKTGTEPESVKFALSCLELLNIGADEGARNLVKVLALSDEFTLHALFVMRQWPDANEVIFDTARHVFGWGRVHAVEALEPETEEIRRWLLAEGWKNDVMAEYSVLTCVEKSGLPDLLARGALDAEDCAALSGLLPPLLAEGPVAGISAIDDRETFLSRCLDCAAERAASLADYAAVLAVRDYCTAQEPPMDALAARCKELLDRPACRALAEDAARTGADFDFAKRLGVPVTAPILARLEADYTANFSAIQFLAGDAGALEQVFSLAERALPLDALSTGPQDESYGGDAFAPHRALAFTVQFLDPYPGQGEALLAAALHCPLTSCRSMALRALIAWRDAGYTPSPAVAAALARLKETEVNDKLKETLAAL